MTLATGMDYVAACSIAAAGRDEYVVVWWNAGRSTRRHSILATTIHIRR